MSQSTRRAGFEPGQMPETYAKFAEVYMRRWTEAVQTYGDALAKAAAAYGDAQSPRSPLETWHDVTTYAADFGQRSLLFWDTMRQRGNNWLAHENVGGRRSDANSRSIAHRRISAGAGPASAAQAPAFGRGAPAHAYAARSAGEQYRRHPAAEGVLAQTAQAS